MDDNGKHLGAHAAQVAQQENLHALLARGDEVTALEVVDATVKEMRAQFPNVPQSHIEDAVAWGFLFKTYEEMRALLTRTDRIELRRANFIHKDFLARLEELQSRARG